MSAPADHPILWLDVASEKPARRRNRGGQESDDCSHRWSSETQFKLEASSRARAVIWNPTSNDPGTLRGTSFQDKKHPCDDERNHTEKRGFNRKSLEERWDVVEFENLKGTPRQLKESKAVAARQPMLAGGEAVPLPIIPRDLETLTYVLRVLLSCWATEPV